VRALSSLTALLAAVSSLVDSRAFVIDNPGAQPKSLTARIRERPMRRQHHHHRNVRCQARQFNLFGPSHATSGGRAPMWITLPEETLRTLTSLMARRLIEHDAVARRLHSAGVRHDI
jgi:hypothetical protein